MGSAVTGANIRRLLFVGRRGRFHLMDFDFGDQDPVSVKISANLLALENKGEYRRSAIIQ
jgi:hypothetical protein